MDMIRYIIPHWEAIIGISYVILNPQEIPKFVMILMAVRQIAEV